ncbi:MAG: dihydroorotase [Bacteriovoracaceae bacterium]|nr:dihydroorotase [Bacteriovoracaceae bacterium]
MNTILLKNCQLISAGPEVGLSNILITDNVVSNICSSTKRLQAQKEYDVRGALVTPGLIDMHVHLRWPDKSSINKDLKENIKSGTEAASRGGFTTIACMPNTNPPICTAELIDSVREAALEHKFCRVIPIPAITKQMKGKTLADFNMYHHKDIFGITDDGRGINCDKIMTEAFKKALENHLTIMQHCEVSHLSNGGAIHKGEVAEQLEIAGIPADAEYEMIKRDLEICRKHPAQYHVMHISCKESVDLIRSAKAEGLPVSAEVTPHHLVLCDEDLLSANFLPNFKMNPPLRTKQDRDALVEALDSGVIDMIATDHAPHTIFDKQKDIHGAAFGVVGLETAFPLLYTHLVLTNKISLKTLVSRMSIDAARVFHLPWGDIEEGHSADLSVFELKRVQEVDPESFVSKGKNTPFAGMKLWGWPSLTILKGNVVWEKKW